MNIAHITLLPSRCVDNKLGQNTVNRQPAALFVLGQMKHAAGGKIYLLAL